MKLRLILPLVATILVAACSNYGPAPVTSESLVTATATVESVDQSTRKVRLRNSDGTSLTVTAGPEVVNLPQLAVGDVVTIDYYEAVTLAMADAGESGDVSATVGGVAAPEGDKPGGAAVVSTTIVVRVVSYDEVTHLATFVTPSGATERATVSPDMRAFAAARKPGDLVSVTLTEAVAVTIAAAAS
jgi:hypothetical protein